jgi:ribosomal protein S18 acetylase RimI-like enzyme
MDAKKPLSLANNSDLACYPKKTESLVSRARLAAQNGMHHIVPLSNCDWYDEGRGPNVTLRQATEKDEAFLRKLHREAMGPHVEAALGWWDADEQEKRFAKAAVSWHQIIVLDGHPIGCLLVFSKPNAVILSRIWIIPSAQGRGIGTHLVLQVCDKAQEDGCPVRLQVLKVNRAQQLYARLGFEIVAETPTHFVMELGVSTSR